jgi:hypothetical protein
VTPPPCPRKLKHSGDLCLIAGLAGTAGMASPRDNATIRRINRGEPSGSAIRACRSKALIAD